MVPRTKSKIACFAAPSFHDDSRPPDVAVWAGADTGKIGTERAGSNAKLESRARRLMPGNGAVVFMLAGTVQIWDDTANCWTAGS
jgi:hypothetical protein